MTAAAAAFECSLVGCLEVVVNAVSNRFAVIRNLEARICRRSCVKLYLR